MIKCKNNHYKIVAIQVFFLFYAHEVAIQMQNLLADIVTALLLEISTEISTN